MILLISTVSATLTESQTAYIAGVREGMLLGSLYCQGQNNATAAAEYNQMVQQFNDNLNATFGADAAGYLLKTMPLPGMPLPGSAPAPEPVMISAPNASAEQPATSVDQLKPIPHTIGGAQKVEARSTDELPNWAMNKLPEGEEGQWL